MIGLGYKANLTDIHSALLLGQLPRLAAQLKRREEICQRYQEAFCKLQNVRFPRVVPGAVSARHLFTIWVPPARRDEILVALQTRGIGVAVNYRAIHLLTYYRRQFGCKPGDFPVAEQIGDSTITLPLYPGMTDAAADEVIAAVREAAC